MGRKVNWLMGLVMASVVGMIAGCSQSSAPTPAKQDAVQSAPAATSAKKLRITMIEGVANDTFYISMARGAKEAAAKLGVEIDIQGALAWDVAQQTQVLNAVIAKKPDVILIAPTDRKGMLAPLKQAVDAGIKVVLVDTTLDDPSLAITSISSDNLEGGKQAAKALADLIGGKGKVFGMNTKPGVSTSDLRMQGFEEGLKAYPGIQYLGVKYNDDDTTKATSVTSAMLQSNPDLAGLFTSNQIGGMGANVALKNAKASDKVKVVQFDGGPDQVKALKEGVVQALIVQKPFEIGAVAVESAVAYVKDGKRDIPKTVQTGYVIATQQNMNDPEVSKYFYTAK